MPFWKKIFHFNFHTPLLQFSITICLLTPLDFTSILDGQFSSCYTIISQHCLFHEGSMQTVIKTMALEAVNF
jgi:hypothetical protein